MQTKRQAYADLFRSACDCFDQMLHDSDFEHDADDAAFHTIAHLVDCRLTIRAQVNSQDPAPKG